MTFKHPPAVLNYLKRVGGEVTNFRKAVIKEYNGHYYRVKAKIKISRTDGVTCDKKQYEPSVDEAGSMLAELQAMDEFPSTILARSIEGLQRKTKGELYIFRDPKVEESEGNIIMVQERRLKADGQKMYLPWSMIGSGEWVAMEPDGALPFWRPPLKDGSGKVMLHEGAKSAAFVQALVERGGDGHPWFKKLAEYSHYGIIGGAMAAERTDWDSLKEERLNELVYVCDNDQPGIDTLKEVSRLWGGSLKAIVFGDHFPKGWDMADPMPKGMFSPSNKRWNGPRLVDLFSAATYATELKPTGEKGRPKAFLKPTFVAEWVHCVRPEVYIHKDWPNKIFTGPEFNNHCCPYSHVSNIDSLLKAEISSKSAIIKYNPGLPPGIFSGDDGGLYVNTYRPSSIVGEAGDAGPWLEFLEHLIPDPADRLEAIRWIAALVCCPGERPHYGMLLISTQQGVGKGTLGEKILEPLVGSWNCSTPSEAQIVESAFDYWSPHKRLAIVHEIYSGHSSKAYNKLKDKITDGKLEVNQKFQAMYTIENHIMMFACSNSEQALKVAAEDRRWFVPRVTDQKRSESYWKKFNFWLRQEGGLEIIRWWLDEWSKENEPAKRGSDSPESTMKSELIEEGYSPGMKAVLNALRSLKTSIDEGEISGSGLFILDSDLVKFVRDRIYEGRHDKMLEKQLTLRKVAKGLGMKVLEKRAQIKGWGGDSLGAMVLSWDESVLGSTPGDLAAAGLKPYKLEERVDF